MKLYNSIAAYTLGWAAFHSGIPYEGRDPALLALQNREDEIAGAIDLAQSWASGWVDANKSSGGMYPGFPFPEVYFLSQVTYLAWGAKTTPQSK